MIHQGIINLAHSSFILVYIQITPGIVEEILLFFLLIYLIRSKARGNEQQCALLKQVKYIVNKIFQNILY